MGEQKMSSKKARVVKAPHGEKMIEVKVRFWTDKIAPKGHVEQKQAWAGGVVRIEANETHGIKPRRPKPFNSLMEITAAIEKVLIDHDIELRRLPKMKKYLG
jgi:hypothetical protein